MSKKIAIVGAQGYSGRELAKLLLRHPEVELAAVFTTNPQWRLHDEITLAEARKVPSFPVSEINQHISLLDVLFLATPAQVSAEIISSLQDYSGMIIDLSGAFRLNKDFSYGLSPWKKISPRSCNRVANPGCYATAILMSLLPLFLAKLVREQGIIIDARSGISGAGRQANSANLFSEIHNDFFPYKLGQHPHAEEIKYHCHEFAHAKVDFTLVNYVLPLHRGIHITIYAEPLNSTVSAEKLQQEIASAYDHFYKDYPLVKHGEYQEQKHPLKHLKSVAGSARTHISYRVLPEKIVIFAAIDNLLKGAAGQAIENLNQYLGLALETGLSTVEGVL